MIGDDIITRWRGMVNDDLEEKRYSAADALIILNDALRTLYDLRPDLALSTDGTMAPFTDLALPTATVNLPEAFRITVAHIMAARTYEDEGNDDFNLKQAADHRQKFLSRI